MNKVSGLAFTYIAVLSIIIGLVIGAYLQIINWIIEFTWHELPGLLGIKQVIWPWLFCLPMGIVIGLLQKYLGQYPLTIEEVLAQVKTEGHFGYHNWWRIVVLGLVILGAGASVGPEASATGIFAGMVY
ncbi:hypothetical protein M8332_04965 [Fructilactobacillus ixorae]|uniref:Chloride channel protein n=1 Tax=Fructilactobacillus ixorae TaxID=1750535 RepID=A0ABY5C2F6_9LACO|nr:hypothetical protein [Fructilactobacillus ixorae]USS92960.1 hypothetical protein M8332_04965 [Fructilactobacillus ixorae]